MLAELTQSLAGTFCHDCYLGTISAGDASGSGSPERARLYEKLSAGGDLPTSAWNPGGCANQGSPLVTGCADTIKQTAIPGIIQWYKDNEGAQIADSDVYFFDDRSININPFMGLSYNARQISCSGRDLDGAIGLCGATLSEIQKVSGVYLCNGLKVDDTNLLEVKEGHYRNATHSISSVMV